MSVFNIKSVFNINNSKPDLNYKYYNVLSFSNWEKILVPCSNDSEQNFFISIVTNSDRNGVEYLETKNGLRFSAFKINHNLKLTKDQFEDWLSSGKLKNVKFY